jgi:hypothetical protein
MQLGREEFLIINNVCMSDSLDVAYFQGHQITPSFFLSPRKTREISNVFGLGSACRSFEMVTS